MTKTVKSIGPVNKMYISQVLVEVPSVMKYLAEEDLMENK